MVSEWLKNPCVLRCVTNVVLLISDVDVFFSFIFMKELAIRGGIYLAATFLVIGGVLVYFSGVLYFGPRQKNKVGKIVKKMMQSSPREFYSKDFEVPVTLDSTTKPGSGASYGAKRIAELTEDDSEEFEEAMAAYGLSALWDAAKSANAKNSCELKHGVPFFRLARFGFMSQPDPQDLGGILNANALYTFATGFIQLAMGGVMLALPDPEKLTNGSNITDTSDPGQIDQVPRVSIWTLIPFTVTSVSFILSLCNMFFDFAGILSEMSMESRMADRIKTKNIKVENDRKAEAERALDDQMERIGAKFANLEGADALLQKQAEERTANETYAMKVEQINKNSLQQLDIELTSYRQRLEMTKKLLNGRAVKRDDVKPGSVLGMEQQFRQEIDHQIQLVNEAMLQAIRALDVNSPTYVADMEKIRADATARISALENLKTPVTEPLKTPVTEPTVIGRG